ncbi:hypothetical protein, conserved [Eimeria tenella]|uniref:RRM domain-containing protein n=1 Tax=Eimeria tenella TaxID=5802 RepID=U6L0Z6_EIMTE|nr:hypothetical protein, conserved [Eimeria tenella]CDJ44072.1 hypothetical protein, conserved [Eimeria tenella]|eukprot:XP_013234821.1 hypothetical protein, conserved [Eimeria tenella]
MAREAMDGFLLKGHELIVKSPMTEEERSLWKETRDAIARGEDRLLRLKRNRLPQAIREAKGLFGTAPFQKDTQEAIQASHPDDIINQGRVVRVTNLPENFSEEDVKQIMEVFGPIMAINLFSHLGEVLIHFYQKDDAAKAISTMDGFLVAS